MKNKELKQKINIIKSKNIFKGINALNTKKEKNNQDLIFIESNFNFHNNKILSINNNIISYSNTENKQNLIEEKNKKNDLKYSNNKNNNELLLQDKFIQTPSNFYSFDRIKKIEYKSFTPNRKTLKKEKEYKKNLRYQNFENNKYIPRINSGLKSSYISKYFYKNNEKIKNIKYSRNQLYPIIKSHKYKTNEITSHLKIKNINILKDNFNNSCREKKKKHHNLLTIENIYFQRESTNNIYKFNEHIEKDHNNINKKAHLSLLLQKKYSIKEIKYPLYNSVIKKYKIINDNNDHLLEKIFKKQTISNFNNKYALKYKTKNSVRKENIKNLFSLLKKYKYSDEDKQTAFNKYNSMKKNI